MKKLFLLLALLPWTGASAYQIEGRITGVSAGTQVCLMIPSYGTEPVYVGQAIIESDTFSIQGRGKGELLCLDLCLFLDGEYSSDVRLIWLSDQAQITMSGAGTDLWKWEITSTLPEQQVSDRLGRIWAETVHNEYWKDQKKLEQALRLYVEQTLPIIEENPDNQAAFQALTGTDYLPYVPFERLEKLFEKMTPEHQEQLQEVYDNY